MELAEDLTEGLADLARKLARASSTIQPEARLFLFMTESAALKRFRIKLALDLTLYCNV